MLVALVGGALLVADPHVAPHPVAAWLGLAVIALTGLVEATTYRRALPRLEEPISCAAGVLIVGFG